MMRGSAIKLVYRSSTSAPDLTVRGQWMYPPESVRGMVGMIRAGLIDLGRHDITCFPLERVNEAVAHAASHAGPFSRTVLDLRAA